MRIDLTIKGNEADMVMEFVSVYKNSYIFKHINSDFSVVCEIPSDTNVDAKESLWFLINESDSFYYVQNKSPLY